MPVAPVTGLVVEALAKHGPRHVAGIGILVILVIGGGAFAYYRFSESRRRRPQAPTSSEPPASTTSGDEPATALDTPRTVRPTAPPTLPPGGTWAVETHGVTKRFGSFTAVKGVDLFVPKGSAFGCLGPNGAGKTTLLRTILGLTRADSGTITLLEVPVPEGRSRALSRVGAIIDEPRFHPHLSGRENLEILAAARGGITATRITPTLERVGLRDFVDAKVATYSMGMRQRLGLAACLIADPELLILDEPMNGLDPSGMHEMRRLIRSLVDEGRTVLLSSHLLDEVERTCDAVAIIDHGQVIRQGPIEDLLNGTDVTLQIECSDAEKAVTILRQSGFGATLGSERGSVTVVLAPETARDRVADINRCLVGEDLSVYELKAERASLEDWFLSVTTEIGAGA
jgi:ABC-2 type transport system ATP-binding protein